MEWSSSVQKQPKFVERDLLDRLLLDLAAEHSRRINEIRKALANDDLILAEDESRDDTLDACPPAAQKSRAINPGKIVQTPDTRQPKDSEWSEALRPAVVSSSRNDVYALASGATWPKDNDFAKPDDLYSAAKNEPANDISNGGSQAAASPGKLRPKTELRAVVNDPMLAEDGEPLGWMVFGRQQKRHDTQTSVGSGKSPTSPKSTMSRQKSETHLASAASADIVRQISENTVETMFSRSAKEKFISIPVEFDDEALPARKRSAIKDNAAGDSSYPSEESGKEKTESSELLGAVWPVSVPKRSSSNIRLSLTRRPSRTLDARLEIAGLKLARTSRWVINPEQSRNLEKWDIVTMSSLSFVAIVTPVQISMMDCVIECPVIFAANTLVDLVFLVDLVLQFFLMYPKKTDFGHALEYRHNAIVINYLKTWFAIDLLSILPFDTMSVLAESREMTKIKAVKVIRLVRLLKLVRVLKASRLVRRFEVRMSFTYQRLALVKFFAVLLALMHWLACLWALTLMLVDAESGVPRWVDVFDEEEANVVHKTKDTIWKLYIACLYFTSYTITSVGYGDIGPQNIVERSVCTVIVLLSGISWAMVLGQVCGIVGNMDRDEQAFRKTMDDLNFMMDDRQLPHAMRTRLRSFIISNKMAQRHKNQSQVVQSMSPGLQGEVVLEVNRVWLEKVGFLKGFLEYGAHNRNLTGELFNSFVSNIARGLDPMMYAQGETFGLYQRLYILNQGLVGRRGGLHRSGSVWGTDFLLSNISLLQSPRCVCLTYVYVMTISREACLAIVDQYALECPEIQHRVRRYVCWLAVQRGLMTEARKRIGRESSRRRKHSEAVPDAACASGNRKPQDFSGSLLLNVL